MILSNVEIHRALDEKRIILRPEPLPRLPSFGSPSPYQTTSVDLRLGNAISYFKDGLPLDINLQAGPFARLFGPNSITQIISEDQPFVLRPSRMVLGKTLEHIELPIQSDGTCLAA